MGTHALALGGAVLAYRLAARANTHAGYAFGGWKIEVLTAYTSGLLLLLAVAGWLCVEAVQSLRSPGEIAYFEAIGVAVLGLAVNLASAWLLARGARAGAPGPGPRRRGTPILTTTTMGTTMVIRTGIRMAIRNGHSHGHAHDHNFSAAYLHVLADALTSLLAIAALAGGLWLGWRFLDPLVALLGAVVVGRWALQVLRSSSRALVDATQDPALAERIRAAIEVDQDARLADLHVWQVGGRAWCAALSIVADRPLDAAEYRDRLRSIDVLGHVTVEVHRCRGAA